MLDSSFRLQPIDSHYYNDNEDPISFVLHGEKG